MKILVIIILGIIGSVTIYYSVSFDRIEYYGESFKLHKRFLTYEHYQKSFPNIHPSELPRIRRIIEGFSVKKDYSSWEELNEHLFMFKFPGYGVGGGPHFEKENEQFICESVEIPTEFPDELNRVFVAKKIQNGGFRIVDDFIADEDLYFSAIRIEDNAISYISEDGEVLRAITMN